MDLGRSIDKQLKATANLIRAGMKIVIKNSKDIASHRRLEKKMDRVIDLLLARTGNGRYPS